MYQPSFANVRTLALVLLLLAVGSFAPARASDVVNTATVSFVGPEGAITLPTNLVRAVGIDPVPEGGTLFVQKTASRDTAEIGEFVDFTVTVKNVSPVALRQVVIEDGLPFGFVFQRATASIDGVKTSDPQGGGGPSLSFPVGSLDPGRTVTVTYRTRVGVDAPHGDGINRAQATTQTTPAATSNIASVRVILRSGVFTNRGVIFGKVFVDKNQNRVQDAGEVGIPGVRLYTEDGSYAVTDAEGKYSFYGILPRTHVVKLDPLTLPPGAVLEPLNTRNAGDGGSVFAEMKGAEMRKVNFAIANGFDEIMNYVTKMRTAAEANAAGEVTSNLKNSLNRNGPQQLAVDPRSLPSSGLIYPGVSVQPTTQDRTQSADSFVLGGGPQIQIPTMSGNASMRGFSSIAPGPGATSSPSDILNAPLQMQPSVSLEQAATDKAGEPFGFIDLKEHDTLPMTQTTVRVKSVVGAKVSLRVNGHEIPDSRIGKRLTLGTQGVEATEYIGVQLQPGENTLELVQIDQFGNPRGTKAITVIAPDTLGRIQIKTPDNAVADGKTPARVIVELVDHNGVPVTARTALTLETTMGKWLAADLNPRETGVQVFIEGGRAEFALAAPVEPGDSRIRVSSGVLQANAVVSFLPELRPLIGVGVIEGTVNISHLSAGALRPVSSRDTFDTELRNFAVTGNRGSAAGRAAFFLKGKILGSYLLTASYDSEKATREHLFRDIQPDEFYPIYGDSDQRVRSAVHRETLRPDR